MYLQLTTQNVKVNQNRQRVRKSLKTKKQKCFEIKIPLIALYIMKAITAMFMFLFVLTLFFPTLDHWRTFALNHTMFIFLCNF